jgi:YVTN family beta-propeller protein
MVNLGNGGGRLPRGPRRRFRRGRIALAAAAAALLGGLAAYAAAPLLTAGPREDGTGVTPIGWVVTPAGRQVVLRDPLSDLWGDRPYGMALSPDGDTLLVSNDGQSTQSLMVVDARDGRVLQTFPYAAPEALYIGLTFSPDGRRAYASAGGNNKIRVYAVDGQRLTEGSPIALPAVGADGKPVNLYPAGLTIDAAGDTLWVANNLGGSVARVDLSAHPPAVTLVPVGHNPYGAALSEDGRAVYVSNWGDDTVSVVDTATRAARGTLKVGTHPSAMALNQARAELYVADSDSDTISVIDTLTDTVVRTISLRPYAGAAQGSSPNALAVSPEGDTLYVANAGNNDVAVVRLAELDDAARARLAARANRRPGPPAPPAARQDDRGDHPTGDSVAGLIPAAWYPTGLAVSPDGDRLYVANAKGLGAGPNLDGPNPYRPVTPPNQYVGSMMRGTLSFVEVPGREQLARYTQQVVRNNGFDERDSVRAAGPDEQVVPRRPGDPSPIKHVIYVIKENRTYDQVFGSLGKGNGDPALDLFADESAPNQRELARRFVTLDNFYAASEVSADGWNWSTAANANTYVQKNWPANYAPSPGRNRPYEFEGGNLATAPGADPHNAYLWDRLGRAGVSYRNYGFWATGTVPAIVAPTAPDLAAHTDLSYPGYNLAITDQVRVQEWLREFRQFEAAGNLPAFEFVRLPNDHTAGTRPGAPTPRAMVADNDLALGRLVEAVSHSRYWGETAIFVLEDDAQNGPDHVDAHRTIAQVIGPYSQNGRVDATFYSTVSMLRTMELIAGLRPLSQFDAAAIPMLNSFTRRGNTRPYTAIVPQQPLDERNTASAPLAAQSLQFDLSRADLADEQALNESIWKSVKGADSQMPAPGTRFRQVDKTGAGDGGDD